MSTSARAGAEGRHPELGTVCATGLSRQREESARANPLSLLSNHLRAAKSLWNLMISAFPLCFPCGHER